MEVCISLLRENKDTLLGVLEPFIRDPTVSWGRAGRAQRTENANKISTGAIQDNDNTDAKEALLKITERLNGIYNLCHPSGKNDTLRKKSRNSLFLILILPSYLPLFFSSATTPTIFSRLFHFLFFSPFFVP